MDMEIRKLISGDKLRPSENSVFICLIFSLLIVQKSPILFLRIKKFTYWMIL